MLRAKNPPSTLNSLLCSVAVLALSRGSTHFQDCSLSRKGSLVAHPWIAFAFDWLTTEYFHGFTRCHVSFSSLSLFSPFPPSLVFPCLPSTPVLGRTSSIAVMSCSPFLLHADASKIHFERKISSPRVKNVEQILGASRQFHCHFSLAQLRGPVNPPSVLLHQGYKPPSL